MEKTVGISIVEFSFLKNEKEKIEMMVSGVEVTLIVSFKLPFFF